MVMGGTQALSRSTYSKLIPKTENTCSYFSFYQMSMILSVVLGTFMSGIVDQLTGSLRNSIIVFAVIFILGAILLRDIKMTLTKDQNRFLEEWMDFLKIPSVSANPTHNKESSTYWCDCP